MASEAAPPPSPSAPVVPYTRAQIKGVIDDAMENMREGKLMGNEAYRLKREAEKKLQLLERIERGDPLREQMYENEVENLEEIATKELEPVPSERRRKPTQLEVLHNIARQMKMAANGLLAIDQFREDTPDKLREHLEYIALRCYLYHRALGLHRARDLLYVDAKNPTDMRLNENIGFVSYYVKLHSNFWGIEPAKPPSEVRYERARKAEDVAAEKISRSEARKARRRAKKLQEQERAAEDSVQRRRNEQKARRFAKDGTPLYEPATEAEKKAMADNSVKVLQRNQK